jgi:hypothetical protein
MEDSTYVDVPRMLKVNKHNKVIQKAVDLATWLRYSPAAANPSAINFVFTAPSTGALLYEKILMAFNSITLNMTINNASGAAITPFNPGNFALRDYPIHRLFNSVSLTLGSSTLSIPLNDVLKYQGPKASCHLFVL